MFARLSIILLGVVLARAMGASAFAAPSAARICVARIDGAPVYHWRVFNSMLSDDVDRALILREFQRRDFKLPSAILDDAVQREVVEHHSGDKKQFANSLERKGVSVADYRQFLAEEIKINAMCYQVMFN